MSAEREFRATLQSLDTEAFKRRYLETKESQWLAMSRSQLHHWMAEVNSRGLVGELEDAVGEIRLAPARHLVQRGLLESEETPTPSPSTTTTSKSAAELLADKHDREFLQRLVGPRLPLTEDIVSALMHCSRPERVRHLTEMANQGILPMTKETLRYLGKARQETGVAFEWMQEPLTPSEPTPAGRPAEESTSSSSASTTTGDSQSEKGPALVVGPGQVIAQQSTEANFGVRNDAESGYEIVAYRRLPLAGKRDAFVAEGFLYVRNRTLREWFARLTLGRCCPAQRDLQTHHSKGCWLDAVHQNR